MDVRVAINEPRLLGDLVDALAANACDVRRLTDRSITVGGVADDAAQTPAELLFFLRAWAQANPPADVQLL